MALASCRAGGDCEEPRRNNSLQPPPSPRRSGARSSSPRSKGKNEQSFDDDDDLAPGRSRSENGVQSYKKLLTPSAASDAPARRESAPDNEFGEENTSSSWLRHGDKKVDAIPRRQSSRQQAEAKKKSARKVPTKFGEKEAPEPDARPTTSPRFSRLHFWGRKVSPPAEVPQITVQEPDDEPKAKRSILRKMAPSESKKEPSAEPSAQLPQSWHGTSTASSSWKGWQGLGSSESVPEPVSRRPSQSEEGVPTFGKGPSLNSAADGTEQRNAAYASILSASGSVIGSIIGSSSSGVFTDKSNCEVCRKKVGKHNLANRHHCRLCWKNVCSGCSPSCLKIDGYAQLQRVCDPCVRTVTQASVSSTVPARLAALSRDVAKLSNGGIKRVEDSEYQEEGQEHGERKAALSPDESLSTLEEAIEPMSMMHQRAVEKVQRLGEKLRAIVVASNGPSGFTSQAPTSSSVPGGDGVLRTRSLLAGTSSDTPRRSSSVGSFRRSASVDRRRSAAENRDASADSRRSGSRPSGTLRPPDSEGLEAVVGYVSTVVDTLEARKRRVVDETSSTRESQATLREDIKKAEATLAAMQTSMSGSRSSSLSSSMTTPLVQRPDPYEDIPVRRRCPCGCPAPTSVTLFGPTIHTLRQ